MGNCKHENIEQSYKNIHWCNDCNNILIPNWTVKPEPVKLEFETAFVYEITTDSFRATSLAAQTKLSILATSGKRFKITAEEIQE